MSNHVSLLQDLRSGKSCNSEAIAAIESLERYAAQADAYIFELRGRIAEMGRLRARYLLDKRDLEVRLLRLRESEELKRDAEGYRYIRENLLWKSGEWWEFQHVGRNIPFDEFIRAAIDAAGEA